MKTFKDLKFKHTISGKTATLGFNNNYGVVVNKYPEFKDYDLMVIDNTTKKVVIKQHDVLNRGVYLNISKELVSEMMMEIQNSNYLNSISTIYTPFYISETPDGKWNAVNGKVKLYNYNSLELLEQDIHFLQSEDELND